MSTSYAVLIRCPETGKSSDTGIRTTGRESLNTPVFLDGRAFCSHCGQAHAYEGNAYLSVESSSPGQDGWRPNS